MLFLRSVLSKINANRRKQPNGVKRVVRSLRRLGKANKLRKEVPGSGVLALSEELPSEADSVGGLRQDDLAVIRSEEL